MFSTPPSDAAMIGTGAATDSPRRTALGRGEGSPPDVSSATGKQPGLTSRYKQHRLLI